MRQTLNPRRWPPLALLAFGMTACLAACAAPPLKIYTLDAPAVLVDTGPGQTQASLEVWRIVLPDYLDTQDIVLRERQSDQPQRPCPLGKPAFDWRHRPHHRPPRRRTA